MTTAADVLRKELLFVYEGVLTEMRTHAAGDTLIAEWVARLDFHRDEAAQAGLSDVMPPDAARQFAQPEQAEGRAQAIEDASRELVRLKDLKDRMERLGYRQHVPLEITRNYHLEELEDEYNRCQPRAWDALRAALSAKPESPAVEPETKEGDARDAKRLDWLLPVITGEDTPIADARTIALGAQLIKGLDGRPAIDAAMLREVK